MSKLFDTEPPPAERPSPVSPTHDAVQRQDALDAEAALHMELLAQTDAKLDRVNARLDRFYVELHRLKEPVPLSEPAPVHATERRPTPLATASLLLLLGGLLGTHYAGRQAPAVPPAASTDASAATMREAADPAALRLAASPAMGEAPAVVAGLRPATPLPATLPPPPAPPIVTQPADAETAVAPEPFRPVAETPDDGRSGNEPPPTVPPPAEAAAVATPEPLLASAETPGRLSAAPEPIAMMPTPPLPAANPQGSSIPPALMTAPPPVLEAVGRPSVTATPPTPRGLWSRIGQATWWTLALPVRLVVRPLRWILL